MTDSYLLVIRYTAPQCQDDDCDTDISNSKWTESESVALLALIAENKGISIIQGKNRSQVESMYSIGSNDMILRTIMNKL